ncbi:MAG: S8 family peptidase, partial [Cytophagales bacterium]|nr:S8 family peptidase [Armatimonadota bacterium]
MNRIETPQTPHTISATPQTNPSSLSITLSAAAARATTVIGLAVLASISSPVFASPTATETGAIRRWSPASKVFLQKLSPELRGVLTDAHTPARAFRIPGRIARSEAAAGTVRVLVRTSSWLGNRSARRRLGLGGARLGRTFANVGTQMLDATPEQLAALAADASVISISPDYPTAATGSAPMDVNPASIGVPEVAEVAQRLHAHPFTGRGITVAVLDSGIAPVGDIANRIVGFKDFVNGADDTPYDDYGHGTHVAGIVAGSGAASSSDLRQYQGIATGVKIIGAKVLGATGQGTVSDAIAGIEWCIANRAAYNIRVINLSLGAVVRESYQTDPLCQAAERAVASGIVVVATAGNRGKYSTINSPGNDPAVITVGASNNKGTARRGDDVITSYTSRGPAAIDATMKPDLVAPGNKVVSLRAPGSWIDTNQPQTQVPTSEYLSNPEGESAYARFSGSSMAAPAVAGAAAILLQVNPRLSPSGVKAALMASAQLLSGTDPLTGVTGIYDPFTQGAGELNLPGALGIALHLRPGRGLVGTPKPISSIAGEGFYWSLATIPSHWRIRGGAAITLLSGPTLWTSPALFRSGPGLWTDKAIWGGSPSLIYGPGTVRADNVSWNTGGDNVSWNTGGDNVSWNTGGDNVSWNTGGDNVSWNTGGDNV